MTPSLWITGLRAAGGLHLVTVALACFTPIPPDWEANLERLPLVHRRFAIAQNVTIGAFLVTLGLISLGFAPQLASGEPLARAICLATAGFWGGRLIVLPWLHAHTCLTTPLLKLGFAALVAECATYAMAYGWLAVR